jgi:hypothetical protein
MASRNDPEQIKTPCGKLLAWRFDLLQRNVLLKQIFLPETVAIPG